MKNKIKEFIGSGL